LLVGLCKAVFADTQTQPSISFSIKPGLCVLNNAETECRDQLRVYWKSNRDYSLCLYQQAEEQFIYCWKLAHEGEYQFPFAASETTIFELRDTKSQKILIAKTFKILKDHNSRHRRRNPWSFF
jgi:hypothetical protein